MYNLLCSLIQVLSSEYCITFHGDNYCWNNQNITQRFKTQSLCIISEHNHNKEKGRAALWGGDATFCLFIRAINLCITIQRKIYNQPTVIPKNMFHPQICFVRTHPHSLDPSASFFCLPGPCSEEAKIRLLPGLATGLRSSGVDTRRSGSRCLRIRVTIPTF